MNPPGTAETPENASGGVLIAALPGTGPALPAASADAADRMAQLARPRGLITATQVDRGPAVRRALGWLSAAGLDVQAHSRCFSLVTWPEILPETARGARMAAHLAREGAGFIEACAARRPRLIVLLSTVMLDAINAPEMRASLHPVFGEPLAPPRRIADTRLRVLAQRWPGVLMLGLPVSSAQATPQAEQRIIEALRPFFSQRGFE